MPTYIVLGRLTPQAKRSPAEARKSREQGWGEFQKLGIKITPYMTVGPYDLVNIVESPTEELMMRFLVSAGERGNIETTTMRAFPLAEWEKLRGG